MTIKVKNQILKYLYNQKLYGFTYQESFDFGGFDIKNQSLPNDLNELNKLCSNCYLCELSKSRKSVLFSYGKADSKLMFIQDEPTSSEDELNSFYVGNSAEVLTNMIEKVLNIKKEEVYLTSLVKCKSLNGATNSNFDSCNDYLLKQIELVKPKLIVALGEKTHSYLFKNSDFSQNMGKLLKFNCIDYICIHSPSFLRRNPSFKKDTYFDMLKIKNILEELN